MYVQSTYVSGAPIQSGYFDRLALEYCGVLRKREFDARCPREQSERRLTLLAVATRKRLPPAPRAVLASALWCALGCDSFVPVQESAEPPGSCSAVGAPVPEARLLTNSEYRRTIQALLGEAGDPTVNFPHEPEVDGFTNSASTLRANPLLIESFRRAAGLLAQLAKDRGLDLLVPCEGDDAVCADLFIEDFGRRAFRRPLEAGERAAFETLYSRLAPSLGHEEAVSAIIEAALQSPQFLYRVEAPRSLPESGTIALGPYELASRLSYFLWGTMPDEPLLAAAESGGLLSIADVESETRRMLADERARERIVEFHRQWLGVASLSSLARDGAPDGLGASLQQSLDAFVDGVFWAEGATLTDVLTSPTVYVDPLLAELYELNLPDEGFEPRDLRPRRTGLLTQPALLALLANHDQSSPIRRGVFVRERILCAPVPAPPPSVDNSPPDPDPNLTTRQRFAVHTENSDCAMCHLAIDPIGFTFEAFDQLGRVRTEENGIEVDTTGEIVGSGDATIDGPLKDAAQLSTRLATSGQVARCVTTKWFTFALGRPAASTDQCALDSVHTKVAESGGNLIEMLVALTTSPAFRQRAAHPEEP